MGTPDYMAPEQSLDSHTVDIRADLYALGGTLYFLLAGRVPFPGGTLGEKIARHQMREPTPVEEVRPGDAAGRGGRGTKADGQAARGPLPDAGRGGGGAGGGDAFSRGDARRRRFRRRRPRALARPSAQPQTVQDTVAAPSRADNRRRGRADARRRLVLYVGADWRRCVRPACSWRWSCISSRCRRPPFHRPRRRRTGPARRPSPTPGPSCSISGSRKRPPYRPTSR